MIGCKNAYKNTKNVRFVRFPSKPHDIPKKKKWIQAINSKS